MQDLIQLVNDLEIVLATTLAVLAYLYRETIERRQKMKVALHMLMEIWHRIGSHKMNTDAIIDAQLEDVRSRYPEAADEVIAMLEEKRDAIRKGVTDITNEHNRPELERLVSKYDDAVTLIAANDPLLAFQISTASSAHKAIEVVEALNKNAAAIFGDELEPSQIPAINATADVLIGAILNEMESNLLKLAGKIDFLLWSRIKLKIWKKTRTMANPTSNRTMANLLQDISTAQETEIRK